MQAITRASKQPMALELMRRRLIRHDFGSYSMERFVGRPIATGLTTPESRRHQSNTRSSPFDSKAIASSVEATKSRPKRTRKVFIPRKAAVQITDKARNFFKSLLEVSKPDIVGVMLKYDQSKSGEPRMVFSFDFVRAEDLSPDDEGVSLEKNEDGTPKSPRESMNDGLKKLYVHHNAFLKALGSTVDVDVTTLVPILYDQEGNKMDPNA